MAGLRWIWFKGLTAWALPLYEALPVYYPDSTHMKELALLLASVPFLAAYAGLVLSPAIRRRVSREQASAITAILPALLAIGFLASLSLPRNSPLALSDYPRVDGATAAIPFGRELLHELTGLHRPGAAKRVQFHTTHEAYVRLIEGNADLIFAAGPSEQERRQAESAGVKLKLTPVGKDAFVFLVHEDNPVNGLTSDQIRAIYSEKMLNWKEVGGEDERIIAYQRKENSGSQTYMVQNVMKDTRLASPSLRGR
ncbi:substrate-binding domain-containing protein [Paenibacillus sp. CC-CFT747]|nr:substrate-binding domain-containing protein [Paenibacillus sp. CC-CFT747]